MYMRVATFNYDKSKVTEVESRLEEFRSVVSGLEGVVGMYTGRDEEGNGVSVGIYRDEAAANAALPKVQKLWSMVAGYTKTAPVTKPYSTVHPLAGAGL